MSATAEATAWWARPRGGTQTQWIANYQRSLHTRHRSVIVDEVRRLAPDSLLEVGCHCAPNLIRLAEACPSLRMAGLDVNIEAIEGGRAWVRERGYADRIQLNAGQFPGMTAGVETGAFDVVLSCYALAYIAPADLDQALYEMGRLARRAVVLAEPMVGGQATNVETRSLSGYTEWAHNYEAVARWVGTVRGLHARLVPVTPPVDKLNAVLVLERC